MNHGTLVAIAITAVAVPAVLGLAAWGMWRLLELLHSAGRTGL